MAADHRCFSYLWVLRHTDSESRASIAEDAYDFPLDLRTSARLHLKMKSRICMIVGLSIARPCCLPGSLLVDPAPSSSP